MLLLAIWIIVEWYLSAKGSYPANWEFVTNWIIWGFFVLETLVLTCLVRDKRRYLMSNWINLLIIAGGVPLLWGSTAHAGALRSLRILLLFKILLDMSSTIRQMLSSNNIGITLFVSSIITIMAGTSMAAIDPAIETPWDGIWWAWVTVTTVGYGDLVPESPQGKIFGGLLMVLGLGLFSLITASFSAFLISRDEKGIIKKEKIMIKKGEELIEKEQEVVTEEKQAMVRLASIERRMGNLERGLGRLIEQLAVASGAEAKKDEVEEKAPQGPEDKAGG